MNVRELAALLAAFHDQDATVYVIEFVKNKGWDHDAMARDEVFDSTAHMDYLDLRGDVTITEDKPYYNLHTLLLGSME